MEKQLTGFLEKFNSNRKLRIGILAAAALAIALLVLSEFLPSEENVSRNDELLTEQEYLSSLENSITQLVSTIDGVGKVRVMITLNSGTEYVYAVEETADSDRQNQSDSTKQTSNLSRKYIIVKNKDGSEDVVLQKTLLPSVRGVVVVCEGGGNATVSARVTEAVAVALNLDYTQIYVTKMSNY